MFSSSKILEKKWEIIVILALTLAGIFFRAWNFSDWLHFEIDQVYDVDAVRMAVENGPANLTLLGTNAGGGDLRLGPVFYYLEYLSAEIFGNTPEGHAAFVLILSIFSLPLFYLFCRRYFSRKISIGLLAIFAVSAYLVMYSRFSWSPNVLPFLMLLSFYALLRSVDGLEKNKSKWFLLAVLAITICTQIHFNSLLVAIGTALIFLVVKRPRFSAKTWILAVLVILFVYSPVIINEIKTGVQNSHEFIQKISKNTMSKNSRTAALVEGINYNALEFFLILSGQDVINKPQSGSDKRCQDCFDFVAGICLGFVYFSLGILGLIFGLKKSSTQKEKDFLWLNFSWFLVSLFLFIYLARSGFTMQSRFAIVAAPLAVIFLGLAADLLKAEKNNLRLALFSLLVLVLVFTNSLRLKSIFRQLAVADSQKASVQTEDIFPKTDRITLKQQYEIIGYLESKFSRNNFPVYIESNKNEYEATFWYHLGNLGIIDYGPIDTNKLCADANYFLIKTIDDPKDSVNYFDIAETKNFGTLTVFYLRPKAEWINCEAGQNLQRHFTDPEVKAAEMMTWKKVFE